MMRPRLFAEIPAGLAAVSLRLHGGANCRPPISRMGNKAGYSQVILAALGLTSGAGADAYLWAEADADVRGLLSAYPDANLLRRVAEIIRGWSDEEPRALWERLRAERKARGPRPDADGVAAHAWMVPRSWKGDPAAGFRAAHPADPTPNHLGGANYQPNTPAEDVERLAEYATIQSMNRLVCMGGPDLMNTGKGGTRFGGDFSTPSADVAGAFERVAGEVAGFAVTLAHQDRSGGFNSQHIGSPGNRRPYDIGTTAAYCERVTSGWPPVAILPTIPTAAEVAAFLGTPGDLSGVVIYMDPDYVGTTGYRDTFPRADVVRFALDYAAHGATVAVSESVPVEELVAAGWYSTDLTAGRKGQRRTFARVATEALTMNRPPAHIVATQPALFAPAGAA